MWTVLHRMSGQQDSYQLDDGTVTENVQVIREADRINGSYRILLDIDNVVLVWQWAVDHNLIVYLRQPEP